MNINRTRYPADEMIYIPDTYSNESLPGLVGTSAEPNADHDFRNRNRRREISELIGNSSIMESHSSDTDENVTGTLRERFSKISQEELKLQKTKCTDCGVKDARVYCNVCSRVVCCDCLLTSDTHRSHAIQNTPLPVQNPPDPSKFCNPDQLTYLCRKTIFKTCPKLKKLNEEDRVASLSPPLAPNVIRKHLHYLDVDQEWHLALHSLRPTYAVQFLQAFSEAIETMETLNAATQRMFP